MTAPLELANVSWVDRRGACDPSQGTKTIGIRFHQLIESFWVVAVSSSFWNRPVLCQLRPLGSGRQDTQYHHGYPAEPASKPFRNLCYLWKLDSIPQRLASLPLPCTFHDYLFLRSLPPLRKARGDPSTPFSLGILSGALLECLRQRPCRAERILAIPICHKFRMLRNHNVDRHQHALKFLMGLRQKQTPIDMWLLWQLRSLFFCFSAFCFPHTISGGGEWPENVIAIVHLPQRTPSQSLPTGDSSGC